MTAVEDQVRKFEEFLRTADLTALERQYAQDAIAAMKQDEDLGTECRCGQLHSVSSVLNCLLPEETSMSQRIQGDKEGKSGGHVNYYSVDVRFTAKNGPTYTAEAMDIIAALDMTFAEGEAFKAIWRIAAARQGNVKHGMESVRDAEKVKFYGERMIQREKHVVDVPVLHTDEGGKVVRTDEPVVLTLGGHPVDAVDLQLEDDSARGAGYTRC